MAKLITKRKAVFLDRDGVINEEVGELSRIEDFKIFPFVAKAICKIREAGYLAIIITNQPMIAKGFMNKRDLSNIHRKMEVGLALHSARVDAIYYCPHHPEKGFAGEVKKLKIICKCRKPGIGMIKKAVRDFNIDLARSFFIGDSTTDAKTAENASIAFVGVKTGYACKDGKHSIGNRMVRYKNLLKAVEKII